MSTDFGLLGADELAALRRFDECAQDGEGYDVPKDMMQRLAEIGVVRRKSGSYYEHTDFGQHVLNGPITASDQCYHIARELALSIWRSEWQDVAPHFEPLDDLAGVLSQIDNMVSGMSRRVDVDAKRNRNEILTHLLIGHLCAIAQAHHFRPDLEDRITKSVSRYLRAVRLTSTLYANEMESA